MSPSNSSHIFCSMSLSLFNVITSSMSPYVLSMSTVFPLVSSHSPCFFLISASTAANCSFSRSLHPLFISFFS